MKRWERQQENELLPLGDHYRSQSNRIMDALAKSIPLSLLSFPLRLQAIYFHLENSIS